jgi:glutamate synthase domain-containing protein 1
MGAPAALKPFLSVQAANAAEAPFIVVHDRRFSTKTEPACQAATGASLAVGMLRRTG